MKNLKPNEHLTRSSNFIYNRRLQQRRRLNNVCTFYSILPFLPLVVGQVREVLWPDEVVGSSGPPSQQVQLNFMARLAAEVPD